MSTPAGIAERALEQMESATAELQRSRQQIKELEDFIRMEVRKMEMQANIMRDAQRTGGWEGAEKVAMAFERAASRHREMLSD